jgi:hypothetical protein
LPPIEKLPWEKTIEECIETSTSAVEKHCAKKVPEIPFEKTLDPVKVVRTIENLYDPIPSLPSDYRRSIEKLYDDMVEAKKPDQSVVSAKKRKQVHQLGEQPVQSVPPLKVFDEKAIESSRQNTTDYPIAKVAYKLMPQREGSRLSWCELRMSTTSKNTL